MTTIHSHPVSHLVSEIKTTFGSMNTLVTDLEFIRTRMSLFIQTLQDSETTFVVKDDLDQAFVEVLEMLPSAAIWKGKVQYTEVMTTRVSSVQAHAGLHHFMSVLPHFDDPGFCPPMGFQDVTVSGDRHPVFINPLTGLVLEVDWISTDQRQHSDAGMNKRRYRLHAMDAAGKQRYSIFDTESFNDLCSLFEALTKRAEPPLSGPALIACMKHHIIRSKNQPTSHATSLASVLSADPQLLEVAYAASGDWHEVHRAIPAIASWLPCLAAGGSNSLGHRVNFH